MRRYLQAVPRRPGAGKTLGGWARVVTVAALFTPMVHAQTPQNCPALDADVRSRALKAAARTMNTEPVLPTIDREALLPDTCYWQLFVSLPRGRSQGALYVSPDHLFVYPAMQPTRLCEATGPDT